MSTGMNTYSGEAGSNRLTTSKHVPNRLGEKFGWRNQAS